MAGSRLSVSINEASTLLPVAEYSIPCWLALYSFRPLASSCSSSCFKGVFLGFGNSSFILKALCILWLPDGGKPW